jgi:hypothetical protein
MQKYLLALLLATTLLAAPGDFRVSAKSASVASYLYTLRAPTGVRAQGLEDIVVSCAAQACEVELILGGTTPTTGSTVPIGVGWATPTSTSRLLGYAASDATGGTSLWIGYTPASTPLRIPWKYLMFSGSQITVKVTPAAAAVIYVSTAVTELR